MIYDKFADGLKQDSFDIWTGKVSKKQMDEYANTKGLKELARYKQALLDKEKSYFYKVAPEYVTNAVEQISQDVEEYKKRHEVAISHFDRENNPVSFVAVIIKSLKAVAPQKISNFWDLIIAISVFYYIMLLVLIFKVDGMLIVNRPRFSSEYEALRTLTGKGRKVLTKGDKKKE